MIQRRTAIVLSGLVAITAAFIYQPPGELFADSSAESFRRAVPRIAAAKGMQGTSGEVRMHFVKAGDRVAFPLDIRGRSGTLGFRYQWVEAGSNESGDVMRPLDGDTLLAPLTPGFYELNVMRNGVMQRLEEPKLAVIVPFELKFGSTLNGYQIGRYPAEWSRDSRHLYGDAADVAIDADGDGQLTLFDAYRVEQAVDWVERLHPELAGGLGVYSSRRYATPYCHIDARGERKRWRG